MDSSGGVPRFRVLLEEVAPVARGAASDIDHLRCSLSRVSDEVDENGEFTKELVSSVDRREEDVASWTQTAEARLTALEEELECLQAIRRA